MEKDTAKKILKVIFFVVAILAFIGATADSGSLGVGVITGVNAGIVAMVAAVTFYYVALMAFYLLKGVAIVVSSPIWVPIKILKFLFGSKESPSFSLPSSSLPSNIKIKPKWNEPLEPWEIAAANVADAKRFYSTHTKSPGGPYKYTGPPPPFVGGG